MTIDLIFITYNRAADIDRALAMVSSHQEQIQNIIVIDNASADSTREVLEKHRILISNLKVVYSSENLGVAGGRNVGFEQSTADIMVFLDDDAEIVEVDFPAIIAKIFEADAKIGAVAFKVVNPFLNRVRPNEFPHWNKLLIHSPVEREVAYFIGAGHAISREAWKKVGNYPKDFFYSQEELFFCYGLIKQGYSILYTPAVTVLHRQSPTGRVTHQGKWLLLLRNTLLVNWCFLPFPFYLASVPVWCGKVLLRARNIRTVMEALREFEEMKMRPEFKRNPLGFLSFLDLVRRGGRFLW